MAFPPFPYPLPPSPDSGFVRIEFIFTLCLPLDVSCPRSFPGLHAALIQWNFRYLFVNYVFSQVLGLKFGILFDTLRLQFLCRAPL